MKAWAENIIQVTINISSLKILNPDSLMAKRPSSASDVAKSHRDHEESRKSAARPAPSRSQLILGQTPSLDTKLRHHSGREDLNPDEYFMESSCCFV